MPSAEPTAVVDASALLAYLLREPGADAFVRLVGEQPVMSSVNWSEVVQKSMVRGVDVGTLRAAAERAFLQVLDFSVRRAERAASLWPQTRSLGLSLADRACLALAVELAQPAVTADQVWTRLSVDGLRVRCVR